MWWILGGAAGLIALGAMIYAAAGLVAFGAMIYAAASLVAFGAMIYAIVKAPLCVCGREDCGGGCGLR